MNKDRVSDIKQIERFAFDNTIWMLNMFEKKVDSYISTKTKSVRQKERENNLHKLNTIDPHKFYEDPIKALSKDLTKPIWNCVFKVNPKVYVDPFSSGVSQSRSQSLRVPPSSLLEVFNSMVSEFIYKLKLEHQDDSNFDFEIVEADVTEQTKADIPGLSSEEIVENTHHLLAKLSSYYFRESDLLEEGLTDMEEQFSCLGSQLSLFLEALALTEKSGLTVMTQELERFSIIGTRAVSSILDGKSGSILLTNQPQISILNFILHPVLVCLQNVYQVQALQQKLRNKARDHEQMQSEPQEKETPKTGAQQIIFQDLKISASSKTVFINLDGYESDMNLTMARYLSKHVMYISFPKEPLSSSGDEELQNFGLFKSERLLEQFFNQSCESESASQREKIQMQLSGAFELSQEESARNMYVFPIHSKCLSEESSQKLNNQLYEGRFVQLMMKEFLLNQIRDFGPSLIVVSYSGKIKFENDAWTELMQQLTVSSSMRLLMYPNKAKMFCFEQFSREFRNEDTRNPDVDLGCSLDNIQSEQLYYQTFQQPRIDIFAQSFNRPPSNIDTDFLDKISIFLKISSGTHDLRKSHQCDSHIEKYRNFKVMGYFTFLLRKLSRKYPALQKLKSRLSQYETVHRVLGNTYLSNSDTFQKLFGKTISKYHQQLIKSVEVCLNSDPMLLFENKEPRYDRCRQLLSSIHSSHTASQIQSLAEDFRFDYSLQLAAQKVESRFYLHIPKYREKQGEHLQKSKSVEDVISVEFQIPIEKTKERLAVELTPDSSILYTVSRREKQALVYVLNHIPTLKEERFYSFYGVVDEGSDSKADGKVSLRGVEFEQSETLSQFEHLVEFNYFETRGYVFMFWPQIYHSLEHRLCALAGQKYQATSTKLVFRASRSEPGFFKQLKVANQSYDFLIPRLGCTCYQVPDTSKFYIFGGFFTDASNYMKFQADISVLTFGSSNEVQLQNIPKSFFFDCTQEVPPQPNRHQQHFEMSEENSETPLPQSFSSITAFKNDLLRPRIQYEVFEPQIPKIESSQMQASKQHQIFLIGGVGEKFIRPYSFFSDTGYKLTFTSEGALRQVKRIKTNNIIPANLSREIRSRHPKSMSRVKNPQGRNLNLSEGVINEESLVTTRFKYSYDKAEERFSFDHAYEFSDPEKAMERQDLAALKKTPNEYTVNLELRVSSHRGREFNNNFITVLSGNGKKYIFELQFELPTDVRSVHPNYSKAVKLTGASIIAIDITFSMLYCIVKHPSYTLDKCILAHFDTGLLGERLNDSKKLEIGLKPVHTFKEDVSRNVILVVNSETILVLHGYLFENSPAVPEMVLKKKKKTNDVKPIRPCKEPCSLVDLHKLPRLLNEVSCSFFINQSEGRALCLSFKSIARQQEHARLLETVYFRIEQLKFIEAEPQWRLRHEGCYKLCVATAPQQLPSSESVQHAPFLSIVEVRPNKETKETKEKEFFLKADFGGEIFDSFLRTEDADQQLVFKASGVSREAYEKELLSENKKTECIRLEKNLELYEKQPGELSMEEEAA